MLLREVIVRFVNIGGIDDHHCLNFLFTTSLTYMGKPKLNIRYSMADKYTYICWIVDHHRFEAFCS